MTDKFEIAQYELTCAASRPGFLMTGVTNASLNADGKRSAANNRLNSSVKSGAMSVATCHCSGTDSESAAELLSGSCITPATTSLTVIVENNDRVTPGLAAVNVGSDASAVPDLIAATLSTKNVSLVH